jgi:hypothetical protein
MNGFHRMLGWLALFRTAVVHLIPLYIWQFLSRFVVQGCLNLLLFGTSTGLVFFVAICIIVFVVLL